MKIDRLHTKIKDRNEKETELIKKKYCTLFKNNPDLYKRNQIKNNCINFLELAFYNRS